MTKFFSIPNSEFRIRQNLLTSAATSSRPRSSNSTANLAFTLTELLVVLGTLALLVATVLPVFAHTRPNAQGFQCLNNHRQLMVAWHLYAADFGDRVPNNFTIADTQIAISSRQFDSWVNNVMTWSVAGTEANSTTNLAYVTNGALGNYLGGAVAIYKCPADTFLSPLQKKADWTQRIRSSSMNALFGRSDHTASSTTGLAWFNSSYRQFLKTAGAPAPALTWVTLEEHSDSINDGFFLNDPGGNSWGDVPASYHDGACTFSFADGHVEMHQWLSATSKYPVRFNYPPVLGFDVAWKLDFQWYKERCGFTLAR